MSARSLDIFRNVPTKLLKEALREGGGGPKEHKRYLKIRFL